MRRTITTAMIAMSLIAVACGAGDTREPVRPSTTTSTTTTSPPPLDGRVLEITDEFWHSGFRVELTEAEAFKSRSIYASRVSHWLRVWGNFENQGDDVATFEPEMAIVASGKTYGHRRGRPPRVLPNESALGYLTFLVPEDLDLESAEFVVGAADESRARIPLGSLGTAVLLEPADVVISGRLETEHMDFDFTGGSLRYDLPDAHLQLDSGTRALTIHFDVTSRIAGDVQMTADDIALVLPTGSIIEPVAAELGALPGDDEGVTTANRSVTFVVDEQPSGEFTLRLTRDDWFVSEDGATEATFEFGL